MATTITIAKGHAYETEIESVSLSGAFPATAIKVSTAGQRTFLTSILLGTIVEAANEKSDYYFESALDQIVSMLRDNRRILLEEQARV